MKTDTGFHMGTARFDCVCYELKIGNWFGVEAIENIWECAGQTCFMFFLEWFFFSRRNMEMDEETHSKVNYLSCWNILVIGEASRITERDGSIAPPKLIDRSF